MVEVCLVSLKRETDDILRSLAGINDRIRQHFGSLPGGVAPAGQVTLLAKLERLHRTCEWAEQDIGEAMAALNNEISAVASKILMT